MTRHVNEDGKKIIKQWEGCKLISYKDGAGVWTIGYGHTTNAGGMKVGPGLHITQLQAEQLLDSDLVKFEDRVSNAVKVPLTDNQFAALVSFDYNTGAINKASFVSELNKGDYGAVPIGLNKYVMSAGKRVAGLVNRRAAEIGLWSKGSPVASREVAADAKGPLVTKENITFGAGILSSVGSFFTSGPLAYAAAGVFVLAACVGLYLFIRSRN